MAGPLVEGNRDITAKDVTKKRTLGCYATKGWKKMKRNLATRSLHTRNRLAQPRQQLLSDPNELKSIIRDGLVSMNMAEREEFIQTLETEMRRASLNMRAYLVPLGIPGRSPEDLTPTEVGHLIRFLKINVPQAMTAVEKALGRYNSFVINDGRTGHKIAS